MPASRADRLVDNFFILLKCSIAILVISYLEDFISYRRNREEFEKVIGWLKTHSSSSGWNENSFYDAGIVRLEKLCLLTRDEIIFLSDGHIPNSGEFQNSLTGLKQHMVVKFWLKSSNLEEKFDKFVNAGFHSLKRIVSYLEYSDLEDILERDASNAALLWEKIKSLKRQSNLDFDSFPVEEPTSLGLRCAFALWRIAKLISKLTLTVAVFGVIGLIAWGIFLYILLVRFIQSLDFRPLFSRLRNALQSASRHMNSNGNARNHGFWQTVFNLFTPRRTNLTRPLPFNPSQTKFEFSWNENNAIVGEMRSFVVRFYSMFVVHCPCQKISHARAEITVDGNPVPLTMEQNSDYSYLVKFTPVVAAPHKISFCAMEEHIKTFYKSFQPGNVDPSKTSVTIKSSIVVLRPVLPASIMLNECDKFGNKVESSEETLSNYLFTVTKLTDNCPVVNPCITVTQDLDKYVLLLTINTPGCYKATVTFQNTPIGNNTFTIIVLTDKQWDIVMSQAKKPSLNIYHEAFLISDDQEATSKKVYIYLTPKQLFIKEWYWLIFSKRLHTMRVRTTVQLSLLPENDIASGYPLLEICEPGKAKILVACEKRDILVATYAQLLLRQTGGAVSFDSKREHFYSELRRTYDRKSRNRAHISVKRDSILKDSMSATKGFRDSDWGKQLTIEFIGELGMDCGGPRREWFQILCDSLFKPESHFFCKSGSNDAQSLVQPNAIRPESCKKLKYYEFAGKLVGKMIIECAYNRPHYVKARFSKAFLCQIIDLDVSWRHFESDDKELFKTKIEYILKNDPEDLELTFTEDVYDEKQNFIKTVELIPYGSQMKVTESNKRDYLNLVADYRLAKCIKNEIASFKKGLTSLIPDNLLSIFDENELELLICGTEHVSPLDLKENFTKCAGGGQCLEKVLGWFWEIVFGMSQEEIARLLQFTTGSSQVPPGGFKELEPKFQINSHPDKDVLPTAHTCFNMLCLPDYSSKNELQRLLFLALNEGSEGFGLI